MVVILASCLMVRKMVGLNEVVFLHFERIEGSRV